ncbi:MAG: glycosyltransferase family 4 protein [Rhodospirillaceae bacterium]|nr:glycosyltransferase family 4 protein [Rhodospirillales bacterium]
MKALKVAWLYPAPKRQSLEATRQGKEPDHLSAIDAIREFGIEPELVEPLPWPWNPFCNKHSLYSGIDPLRAVKLAASLSRFDLVLSVGESSGLVLLFLRRMLGLKIPIVVWDPALGGDWRPREAMLRWALPRYDRILVVGSNQEALAHERYPGAAPTSTIGHWEDTQFYRPMPAPAKGYVLSVGLDPMRDYAALVEAARGMAAPFIIKTNRPMDTDLPPNVRVIRERISYNALRSLYAGASVVVVPLLDAHHASGVNGVLEAYAMGKPVIVSDSTGIRDFVIPNETALVVKPGDVAGLRQAIASVTASPELAQRLAVAGRQLVETRFSQAAFASRLAAQLWEVWHARAPKESLQCSMP